VIETTLESSPSASVISSVGAERDGLRVAYSGPLFSPAIILTEVYFAGIPFRASAMRRRAEHEERK